MAFGTGLDSSVGWGVEASYNPGTVTTPTLWLPHDSETLNRVKKVVQGNGLRAGITSAYAALRRQSTREAKGNVVMDFPTQGIGVLLKNGALGTSTNVQVGSTAAWTQVHTLGAVKGKSLTCQVGRPAGDGTVYPFTYVGGKVTDWELSLSTDQLMKINLGLDFADELTTTGTPTGPALTTPTYSTTVSAFSFTQASTLTLAGASVAAVKKISIKSTNPVAGARYYLGSAGVKAEQLTNGFRDVVGTMECEFVSLAALYASFRDDTQLAFVFKVSGDVVPTTATPYSLQVDIPAMFLDGDTPNVAGPDILTQTVPFVGRYDGTNSAIKLTYVTGADAAV